VATRSVIGDGNIRDDDLAGLVQADRPRRSRRQVDVPAAYKRAAIIDAHDHASRVTHPNKRSERQGAVSRSHRRTIQTLAVRGATPTQTITAAIDACNFRTRDLAAANQQGSRQQQQRAKEQLAHLATSPVFRNLPTQKDSTASPHRLNTMRIAMQLAAKFRQRSAREINDSGAAFACRLHNKKNAICVLLPTMRGQ
jgi:hypothetical protein